MRMLGCKLLSFCILFGNNLLSQDITTRQQQKIVPPSPDATAFAKFGNVPVGLYTGVPQVSVPLYNLNIRDVSIPISLSYHSAGFTVEEEAGWSGLGWTLNAGGVITRQIRGKNDLAKLRDGFHKKQNGSSNFWLTDFAYKGYPYDPPISNPVTQGDITAVCLNETDPEPDIFYFNVLGKSGSFILEKGPDQILNGNILRGTSKTGEKIDIRFDVSKAQWIISTIDGFKYYFGTKELQETKRTPTPMVIGDKVIPLPVIDEEAYYGFEFYNSEDFNLTGWYLDSLVSPLNEVVKYEYDMPFTHANGDSYSIYGSVKNSFTDQMDAFVSLSNVAGTGNSCFADLLADHVVRDMSQTYTAHVYLKEIKFSNGKIVFHKSDREDIRAANGIDATPFNGILSTTIGYISSNSKGPQKVDGFTVYNGQNEVIKRISFSYSYFNATYSGANAFLHKRLKLESVRECSSNSENCLPPTVFTYDESVGLPSKYSRAIDFWGYYNGAIGNQTRVPYGTYSVNGINAARQLGNADRQPNAIFMKAGILKKVTYPTGGWTEMEFEPHDYYHFGNGAWRITNFENDNILVQPLGVLSSVGGTTADLVQSFSLSQSSQVNIVRTLGFYPAIQSSTPCCAPNPFSGIDGNGSPFNYHYSEFSPYIEIRRQSDNSLVQSFNLGEYQTFLNTCVSACGNPANANHGAIMSSVGTMQLAGGNYLMIIKQYQDFKSTLSLDIRTIKPREIPLVNGVYAKTAGGLRIKKLTDFDAVTNTINVKKFDYTLIASDGSKRSSGRLMMFPNNHVLEASVISTAGNQNQCGATVVKLYGKSISNLPLGNSASGGVVGYDKITVIQDNNGREEHYYDNVEEYLLPNAEFIYGMPNVVRTSNGNLLRTKVYNQSGVLVSETVKEYTQQLQKFIPALAYRQTYSGAIFYIGGNVLNASCYFYQASQNFNVIADRHVPTREINYAYSLSGGQPLVTTSDFMYDVSSHLQLNSKEMTTSKGKVDKLLFTYTSDAPWIPGEVWDQNFLIQPVRQQKYLDNNPIADFKLQYFVKGNGKAFLSKSESANGANPLEEESAYINYDEKNNLLEFRNRDGLSNSFEWGYNKTLPIVKIVNAQNSRRVYTQRNPAIGTGSFSWSAGSYGQKVQTLKQSRTGNFTINLDITGGSGPSGSKISLDYTLTGPVVRSGVLCASAYSSCAVGLISSVTLAGIPAGDYTLTVQPSSANSLSASVNYSFQAYTEQLVDDGEKEFFYQGFEEIDGINIGFGNAGAGIKYWIGTSGFQVDFVKPNSRKYFIQWLSFDHGKWILNQQVYASNSMVLSGKIDEVRIFPADAQMTTFTYLPLIGITSQMDPRGKITYYEYDEFNRLLIIRDQDRNVLKKYEYKYQQPAS
jgi:YD repeat-containing protein